MTRDELQRLELGPEPNQPPGGIGSVRIHAHCAGNAQEVLEKAKEVLRVMLLVDPAKWPDDADWPKILPQWFVGRCGPEPTDEEVERRKHLPWEQKLRVADVSDWDLLGWVHWFRPENRFWWWWDAAAFTPDLLVVAIEVQEWPFPWGSLKWLLRAAGARKVEAEP